MHFSVHSGVSLPWYFQPRPKVPWIFWPLWLNHWLDNSESAKENYLPSGLWNSNPQKTKISILFTIVNFGGQITDVLVIKAQNNYIFTYQCRWRYGQVWTKILILAQSTPAFVVRVYIIFVLAVTHINTSKSTTTYFNLALGAQKLSAKVEMFYYGNYTSIICWLISFEPLELKK